ncbi:MAG: polyphosphate polymerase domain-containing protein [Thermomicrobiales bacterium]|nr:polyphosphate polymerase domain-containing protein [Thermomicrobiales bacterium]
MIATRSQPHPPPENGSPSTADVLAAIRRFNRFELKYVADRRLVEAFRQELPDKLARDPHGVDGFYPIWSTYYDTPDLRFYWEKIDGEKFRRKLRIRHYGTPDELTGETPVFVEIKQRVNRVTQKRRVRLPYEAALRLCAGHPPEDCDPQDAAVMDEIEVMVRQNMLRPTTVVGYVREAFFGRDEDSGLRVTIDSRIRGRDRDLDLRWQGENRYIIPPHLSVVEMKVNERVPYWLTELIARHNISLIRVSKYCQSIERFGLAPRSRRIFDEPFVEDVEESVVLEQRVHA